MPEPNDPLGGLPDIVRESNRPIIIYQGGPPGVLDASTSNALGLLSWLATLTLCIGIIVFSVWQVWNPGHDPRQYSPIYAEGRPLGLAGQIEERRQINARAAGLSDFLTQLRGQHLDSAHSTAAHPLISDRDGIDDLRREWDGMCNQIRARIYDRRVGQIDARAAEIRRQRARASDPSDRARLDGVLTDLQLQRQDQIARRRADTDPALRCVPAAEAPVCSDSNDDAWCNPQLKRPREFVDGVS